MGSTNHAWICTYFNRVVNPLLPDINDIDISDIAHSLANLCRFTGHCQFYTVAQHSVWVSYLVDPRYAREGLMHDASEAYLNDLNSPVKHLIQGDYKRMERELEACVAKKWGLCYKDGWPEAVQKADNLAFRLEVIRLFDYGNPLWQYYKIDPAEYKAAPYRIAELQNPEQAMMGFLMRYHELFDKQVTEDPGTEVIFAG